MRQNRELDIVNDMGNHKPFGGIDATVLKLLAMFFMLLDHYWATLATGNAWVLTYIGRLAFPIFAFQIVEGFYHTSDRRKYAKRLLIFALISEIPFDLFCEGMPFYPFHQNVMFTLLLGLLAVGAVDDARKAGTPKAWAKGIGLFAGFCLLSLIGMTDYNITGVLTVFVFYVFHQGRFAWLGQLASLVLLDIVLFEGQVIPTTIGGMSFEFPIEGFAVLGLLFIWLYNGKKGSRNKVLQYCAYWFYPVHMLILYALYWIVR